jgi:anti-anti-sigma regulatory factor
LQIAALQQSFYENNASLVICGLQPAVEDRLEELGLSETMNITPTESEAWDIVQMEEIERELLDSEDVEFPSHGEKD